MATTKSSGIVRKASEAAGSTVDRLSPSRGGTASQWPFWSRHAAGRRLNSHFGPVMRHDGVSMAILVSSRGGTASQWPFWSRHAAGWRLNGHFGLVPRRDGVSMAILASSCGGMASQWPFWSCHAAGRRLNGHFGPVMRHDGVSMAILASSCDMMTETHPTFFAFRFPFLAYGLQVIILSLLLRAFHVGALRLHGEKDK